MTSILFVVKFGRFGPAHVIACNSPRRSPVKTATAKNGRHRGSAASRKRRISARVHTRRSRRGVARRRSLRAGFDGSLPPIDGGLQNLTE